MDVLPFALETQPTWHSIGGNRAYGRNVVACCGCGQRLGRGMYYLLDTQSLAAARKALVTLTPGYRQNSVGVYSRKRPPRRSTEAASIFPEDRDILEGITVHIGERIQRDAVVVCHCCSKRQVVRGQ